MAEPSEAPQDALVALAVMLMELGSVIVILPVDVQPVASEML